MIIPFVPIRCRPTAPAGLTLVEMLVATAASLILFGAVMAIFNVLGTAVNNSRSMSEMEGQLCVLANQLSRDLANTTAKRGVNGLEVMPPTGSADGYFEIVEGPMSDLYDASLTPRFPSNDKDDVVGDVDDALIFTCRSAGEPYRGNFDGIVLEEPEAEVAYFCGNPVNNDEDAPTFNKTLPTTYTLYRRQVLVSSTAVGNAPFNTEPVAVDAEGDPVYEPRTAGWEDVAGQAGGGYWDNVYREYDLSVRFQNAHTDADGNVFGPFLVLNTMNDLQRRSARIGHRMAVASNVELPLLDVSSSAGNPNPRVDSGWQIMPDNVAVDCIIAKNVLAFDVRVLDSQARPATSNLGLQLVPSDQDYWAGSRGNVEPLHVDLGYNRLNIGGGDSANSTFSANSTVLSSGSRNTFDTWSIENSDTPPYEVDGLAGIQVTIRLIDPRSKRIVQRTITHSF